MDAGRLAHKLVAHASSIQTHYEHIDAAGLQERQALLFVVCKRYPHFLLDKKLSEKMAEGRLAVNYKDV
jgi:hypothetical protein